MRSPLLVLALSVAACAGGGDPTDTDTDAAGGATDADRYAFTGRTGASSVAYDGQIFRHLLIEELKTYVGGLTARIDGGSYTPVAGDIERDLEFYLAFDDASGADVAFAFSTMPAPAQSTFQEVSSGKDLWGKLAGNDEVGQHKDWTTGFVGWDADGVTTPESLVRAWMAQLDALGVDRANGTIPKDPAGADIASVFVTAQGQDLQQLLQKFLLGAVAFSQGVDDYLDESDAGKGILSDHTAVEEGKTYTALEHQWDEGFGYFGAAIDYATWTDDEIADLGHKDTVEADGAIDLLTEVSWGASQNAAKRDRGAVAATDFTADAWEGFWEGRALLARTTGPLTDAELAELKQWRDQAVTAWDSALAATALHYINDTLQDMAKFGTDEYDFAAHAKHWSELKGFALSLQFNPFSPLSDAQHASLHAAIGTAPVLPSAPEADQTAYAVALREARALLGTAYGFDPANLGDDDGNGGW